MVLSVRRLLLVAAAVRGAYLAATLGVARLLDDYDSSAILLGGGCDDGWPESVAKAQQAVPWVVWDSVFLHRISACGYEYEQFFAFFPGLPGLVRLVQTSGLLERLQAAGLQLPSLYAFSVITLVINNALFLLSVALLARLSQRVLRDDRMAAAAALVFIASPASIHHSMLYTEALFTATSWLGMYCLYCRQASMAAALAFAASTATRSNGLLNAGFLLHEHGRRFLKAWHNNAKVAALGQLLLGGLTAVITVLPYFAYTLFGYNTFCTGVYGGGAQRPWCSKALPSAYGYVQDAYWNVGWLRYYEWSQIPNFLLAAPTLLLSLWGPLAYGCANPHHLCTGGLLPRPLLLRLFSGTGRAAGNGSGGGGCTAIISNGGAGKGCSGAAQQQKRVPQQKRGCSRLAWLIPGYEQHRSGGSRGCSGGGADANDACACPPATIPGVAYQSLRQRQQEVAAARQQQQQQPGQTQQQQQQQQRRMSVEAVYSWHQQQQLQHARLASGGGAVVRPPHWRGAGGAGPAATAPCPVSVVAASPGSGGLAAQCSCTTGGAFYRPEAAVFVVHWGFLAAVCLAVVHIQVSTRFLSSCAPLYWFAALLMLQRGGGAGVLRWLLWWYCWAFMGVGAVFFTNFYPWT